MPGGDDGFLPGLMNLRVLAQQLPMQGFAVEARHALLHRMARAPALQKLVDRHAAVSERQIWRGKRAAALRVEVIEIVGINQRDGQIFRTATGRRHGSDVQAPAHR